MSAPAQPGMDRPNMALRVEKPLPLAALVLLRHCYRFVNEDWQHLPRDESADQGFEVGLRESCLAKLAGWVVSQHREMNLGMGLMTASGVLHEVDVVAQREPTVGILELKNRVGWPPEKNDVIVFFAKILDYLCLTPALLRSYLVLLCEIISVRAPLGGVARAGVEAAGTGPSGGTSDRSGPPRYAATPDSPPRPSAPDSAAAPGAAR